MARIRSPNYPQVELPEAINLVRKVFKDEGKNFAPREVVAELLGYSSVNGASDKKVSAITAYGLFDRNAERELRVSDLAVRILHPEDGEEENQALLEAALSPNLFREISEKWPVTPPSDSNLKSYLIRQGFNQNSVAQVIAVYRGTMSMVSVENDDTTPFEEEPVAEIQQPTPITKMVAASVPQSTISKPIVFDMETVSGQYSYNNAEDLADFISKLEMIKALLPDKD